MQLWRIVRFALSVQVFSVASVTICAAQAKSTNWKLTPTIVVGDGSTDIILERVSSLQLHKSGRLLVADVGATTIFVVDSMGKQMPAIGRKGAGPAEYRSPYALATIGDTIAVLDPGNARIGLFNSKGEWQGQWSAPNITGSDIRLFRVASGQFYKLDVRRESNRTVSIYVRHDSKGARDSVSPPDPAPSETGVMCRVAGGISFFSSIYEPRHIRIPAPGNSVLDATTDNYRVVQSNAAATTVATFSGSAPRLPLSDAEWQNSIKGWTKFSKENATTGCNHSSIVRPSIKPAIRAMWFDDTGRLWIERYAEKGFAFDVFNAKGNQVATMAAPDREAGVEPTVVGNRIAVVALHADGAQVVRVYRFGVSR